MHCIAKRISNRAHALQDRVVYSMPSMIALQDFRDSHILLHRVGASMLKVKNADRPTLPASVLALMEIAEIAVTNGEKRRNAEECDSDDDIGDVHCLTAFGTIMPCALCKSIGSLAGPRGSECVKQCALCRLGWHESCATAAANSLYQPVSEAKTDLHADLLHTPPDGILELDDVPDIFLFGLYRGDEAHRVSRST